MNKTKVSDLAYIRLRSPDLDCAEEFLTDFGLTRVERTTTALYMRGTGPMHHLHVTELGEPKVVGMAFTVDSLEVLEEFSRQSGATPVESIDEPGGGHRVRLADPNGYQVEIVHGIARHDPLPVQPRQMNLGNAQPQRTGSLMRVPRQPSQVKRIGHVVMVAPDYVRTLRWYQQTLGLLPSDNVWLDGPEDTFASFNRLDRGEEYVDHHVFMLSRGAGRGAGMNHVSFEVQDLDDLMVGHDFLRAKNRKHYWGVGRHHLGSQIFDYWADPWGRGHEHWTDGDLLNSSHEFTNVPIREGFNSQWGDAPPLEFVELASA
ncbi:VOC family protein [Paraburkholderia nemoris]|uniref:VOC family protein n=1 Tax=Paraburkholderia nemoris TaxID=2793076 RepID=UPI0038B9CA6C